MRYESVSQVYDPNFQHKGGGGKKGQDQGVSQEGKIHMIRVKRLKFTLKGSNYEDSQKTALGGKISVATVRLTALLRM